MLNYRLNDISKAPSRRSGTKALPLVPNEVYLDIFDLAEFSDENSFAEVKRIMSNLALVCRFFCAMALPRVFKTLKFCGKSAQGDAEEPGYATFCRMLIQDKEPTRSLALHIKSCQFRDWLSPDPALEWVFSGCLKLYTQSLRRMENLESVSLTATPLTANLLKVLAYLRPLKSLEVLRCRVEYSPKDACSIPALQISTLICHASTSFETNYCILDDLIDMSYLRILRTDSWQMTKSLMQQPGVSILEELDLSIAVIPENASILLDFLNRTPSMLVLRFPKNETKATLDLTRLSKSALPKLRHVCCHPSLVSTLIPGRPVDSVDISGVASTDASTISMLKRSTADSISTLAIPSSLFFVTPFSQHFPHLQRLCLDVPRLESFYRVSSSFNGDIFRCYISDIVFDN